MKNLQLYILALLAYLPLQADTTTQSVTASGNDGAPTTATITVDPGTCVLSINSITLDVTGSSYTSSNCITLGDDWYGFDLILDGGAPVVDNGCAAELEAYAIPTNTSTITIESQDNDGFPTDNVNMDFSITIDFTPATLPEATFTVVEDCANNQYNVNVEVTNLNGATSVNITDGTTTYETAVGLGAYVVGPFTGATPVTLNVVGDNNCTLSSAALTGCDPCGPGAPSDDCATATPLDLSQPFVGSTDCNYTDVSETTSGFCGSIDNNSWFSFTPAATDVTIDWDITGTSATGAFACGTNPAATTDDGIQISAWEGSCGSLTLITGACENTTGGIGASGSFVMSGLTVGDEYYIQIDGYAGELCDYAFEPIAGVALTPANDLCADAEAITCGATITSDNVLATATDAPGACGGTTGTGAGVWYTFAGDGSTINFSTDATNTTFDTEITVFTGSCAALVCEGGDDDGGAGLTSSIDVVTTNGTTYYVYVSGVGTATGTFDLTATCTANACDATYSYTTAAVCSGEAPTFTIDPGCVAPSTLFDPVAGTSAEHLDLDWYVYAPAGVPSEAPVGYVPAPTVDNNFPISNPDLIGGDDGLGGTWNGTICADLTLGATLTVDNPTCAPITVTYFALVWDRNLNTDGDSNSGEYGSSPCNDLRFDVVVYPQTLSVVTTDDGTTCGTPTVVLQNGAGTACATQSGIGTGAAAAGACANNGDTLNWDFSADAAITALATAPATCAVPATLTGTVTCAACAAACTPNNGTISID